MHRVGFEPTIPVFERAKTVLALDRAATVMGTVPALLNRCKDIGRAFSYMTDVDYISFETKSIFFCPPFLFLGHGAHCFTIWAFSDFFTTMACIIYFNVIRIITAVFEYVAIPFWEAFLVST
jgi:hypothetical protein